MEELLKKVAPLVLLALAAVFILVLNVGWPALAKNYPGSHYRKQLTDVTWLNYGRLPLNGIRMTVGNMRKSDEKVNLGSNSRGLFVSSLSVWTIFRPPLFIPWTDIEVAWSETQLPVVDIPIRSARLKFSKVPNISISMSGPLAKDLLAHAPPPLSTNSPTHPIYGDRAQSVDP